MANSIGSNTSGNITAHSNALSPPGSKNSDIGKGSYTNEKDSHSGKDGNNTTATSGSLSSSSPIIGNIVTQVGNGGGDNIVQQLEFLVQGEFVPFNSPEKVKQSIDKLSKQNGGWAKERIRAFNEVIQGAAEYRDIENIRSFVNDDNSTNNLRKANQEDGDVLGANIDVFDSDADTILRSSQSFDRKVDKNQKSDRKSNTRKDNVKDSVDDNNVKGTNVKDTISSSNKRLLRSTNRVAFKMLFATREFGFSLNSSTFSDDSLQEMLNRTKEGLPSTSLLSKKENELLQKIFTNISKFLPTKNLFNSKLMEKFLKIKNNSSEDKNKNNNKDKSPRSLFAEQKQKEMLFLSKESLISIINGDEGGGGQQSQQDGQSEEDEDEKRENEKKKKRVSIDGICPSNRVINEFAVFLEHAYGKDAKSSLSSSDAVSEKKISKTKNSEDGYVFFQSESFASQSDMSSITSFSSSMAMLFLLNAQFLHTYLSEEMKSYKLMTKSYGIMRSAQEAISYKLAIDASGKIDLQKLKCTPPVDLPNNNDASVSDILAYYGVFSDATASIKALATGAHSGQYMQAIIPLVQNLASNVQTKMKEEQTRLNGVMKKVNVDYNTGLQLINKALTYVQNVCLKYMMGR